MLIFWTSFLFKLFNFQLFTDVFEYTAIFKITKFTDRFRKPQLFLKRMFLVFPKSSLQK